MELFDEIFDERRRELAFEAQTYYDYVRNGRKMERKEVSVAYSSYTARQYNEIDPQTSRRTMCLIPSEEIVYRIPLPSTTRKRYNILLFFSFFQIMINFSFRLFSILIFLLLTAEVCGKQVKSDLSVLYVGGSPEIETMIHNPEPAVLEKSVRKRTAAFEKLLRRYFRNVEVVSARDYLPEMSDRYDVTIMDGTPRELQPAQEIVNEEGMIISRRNPAYLPEDFDRPMVFPHFQRIRQRLPVSPYKTECLRRSRF